MTNETVTVCASAVGEQLTQQLHQGQEMVNQVLAWLTNQGLTFALRLVVSALVLVIGMFVIRGIVAMVGKAVAKSGRGNALFSNFIRNATSKICWIILLVVILEQLGVNVAPIIAGLGVTGFILGFAFQESLGNLASGLMIAVNQPFKIGDYVIVAGHEGTVKEVDMMATVLATGDNKKVVIPNKSAWGAPIVNFSALGRRRVDIQIGIDYSCDVAKAIRIAQETLPRVAGVLAEPAPSVFVALLADSAVTLNVRPWTEGANYWSVYNDVQVAIKAAFEANGINIPFPQLTVHLDGRGGM